MMKLKIFTILFLSLLLQSFANAQNNIDFDDLPEVDDMMIQLTNPNADTIIIGMHGGPSDMIYLGDWEFFENISTFSVVEVMQHQHYRPEILADPQTTLETGIKYNDTTVAMLQKVVLHFTNQNKTVVITGHSFGAFIMTEYVDDYGMADVHRVIPMEGRMDMNDEIWEAFATGYWGGFESDGITTIIDPIPAMDEDLATFKLMAGIGYNRWTDSLANENLSRLMYVYAERDEAVGQLLFDEINMLETASATVLGITNGEHGDAFDPFYMNQVLDFIRDDFDVSVPRIAVEQVKMYPTTFSEFLVVETEAEGKLSLWNNSGQLISEHQCVQGNNTFTFEKLPTGFYIAHFVSEDGKRFTEKLIAK